MRADVGRRCAEPIAGVPALGDFAVVFSDRFLLGRGRRKVRIEQMVDEDL